MSETRVDVAGRVAPLVIRVNGDDPTFELGTDRIRACALAEIEPVLLDLLDLAAVVFAADSSVRRGGLARAGMGRDWRRRFHLHMPVRRPDLWRGSGVANALRISLDFLSGDDVSFDFSPLEDPGPRDPLFAYNPDGATFAADEVVLFSGGLDSFAGALTSLTAQPSSKIILLSHWSSQKVVTRQRRLGAFLAGRFPGRVMHVIVKGRRTGHEAVDTTQRTRSFFFAALGQAVARLFGARRVCFYENGFISHNLPLSDQIVGTMASRTTHPWSLALLSGFLARILDEAVPLENPFQWLTKTEVLHRIREAGASEMIVQAVSCTSVREQTRLHTHCGACSQCLDRRFAVLAAGLEEHDPPEIYDTDVLLGARTDPDSRTIALDWARHAIRLGDMTDAEYQGRFGQELMRIVRGFPEREAGDVIRDTIGLHRRQSAAVRRVFEQVLGENTPDLVGNALPETCLLRMHLGSALRLDEDAPKAALVPDWMLGQLPEDVAGPAEGGTGFPLQVEFADGDRPVVIAHGLGRVEGAPARVPIGLLPRLVADRNEGRGPDDHRFVAAADIPGLDNASGATVRQWVNRCRKTLAADFEAIHGVPPPRDLLIETAARRGYRLDPTLEIVSAAAPNRAPPR